jgi:hypothetical protein
MVLPCCTQTPSNRDAAEPINARNAALWNAFHNCSVAPKPQYHQWVAKVLGVSKTRVAISQECDGVMNVIAAVESGHAPAVVGEFTTVVAGNRARFIPFASKASYMDVGLLYRKSENAENVKKLIASSLDFKQFSKQRP